MSASRLAPVRGTGRRSAARRSAVRVLTFGLLALAVHALGAQATPGATSTDGAPSLGAVAPHRPLDLSVAVRGGTLGYGLELGKLVASHLGVRAGGYLLTYARSQQLSNVQYDAQLKFQHASLLVDLFPGHRGRFHLTGGVVAGTSEATGTGVPQGGTFHFNGQTYTSAQVGAVSGSVRYPSARPYVGWGWGSPAKNRGPWGFSTDVGVVYGTPTAVLDVSGAEADPQLRIDVEAERAKAQAQINKYARFYPVLNWGLTYRF